jgi:hypothetical protein
LASLEKSNREAWLGFIFTFQKNLELWKGKFLSMSGRIIMLNSILASLSLYLFLSVYQIDRLRRRFLWARVEVVHTRKYALISWEVVCLDKEHGGIGSGCDEYFSFI